MSLHESLKLFRATFLVHEIRRMKQLNFKVFKNVFLQSLVSGVKIEICRGYGSIWKMFPGGFFLTLKYEKKRYFMVLD